MENEGKENAENDLSRNQDLRNVVCHKSALTKRCGTFTLHCSTASRTPVSVTFTACVNEYNNKECTTIQKGRGVLYVHTTQKYRRVRSVGDTKYLKCTAVRCDGSAKLDGDH